MSEKEHCLKEREWGELSVEIATIKKDVKETKDEIKIIHNKINDLPDKMNLAFKETFAAKIDVEVMKQKQETIQYVVFWVAGIVGCGLAYLIGLAIMNALHIGGN